MRAARGPSDRSGDLRCRQGQCRTYRTALLDKFAVDKVINVGVAGGIQPDVHVGDVVIGVSSTTYDVGPSIMGRVLPLCIQL